MYMYKRKGIKSIRKSIGNHSNPIIYLRKNKISVRLFTAGTKKHLKMEKKPRDSFWINIRNELFQISIE